MSYFSGTAVIMSLHKPTITLALIFIISLAKLKTTCSKCWLGRTDSWTGRQVDFYLPPQKLILLEEV